MSDTLRLALPRIDAAQAQKHVTHNEALDLLDALVHLSVHARGLDRPPEKPAEGARYILGGAPSGAFDGRALEVAAYDDGAWRFFAPRKGWRAYVEQEAKLVVFDGRAWVPLGGDLTEVQDLLRAGIGGKADADNPFLARLNSALFMALRKSEGGTGDLRVKVDKEAGEGVASTIYSSNFSGRAETGLMGDEQFRIKVSPDGENWKEALRVDPASGRVHFPNGACDLAPFAGATSGTPAAYSLHAPACGPLPEDALFWFMPHAPNATALNVDPTLQIDGMDAAPAPLRMHDGASLPQGSLEAGKAFLARKAGGGYRVQGIRAPFDLVNLLEDGGRFAGAVEPVTPTVSAYVDVAYFASLNGAARANYGVARANSSTFGGTGAALAPAIADLCAKIRSGPALINGSEFFVLQVTAGAGTSLPVTVQGVSFHQVFGGTRVTGRAQTLGLYFRVMSGGLVIAPSDACPRVLVDGVVHDHLADAPERIFRAANGWRHMQRWLVAPGGAPANFWPLRATPGTVFLIALPAVVPGLETLPWDIGHIPSIRSWR